MTMQIRDIVLYGRQGQLRVLPLRPGALNVVTGESGTGKSALIDIVDYCLGRNSCTVPARVIRDSVQWYALRLQLAGSQMFVARAVPVPPLSTNSEVYYAVGEAVEIPPMDRLRGNTNPASLNEFLSRMLGVSPNLHTPPEGQSREPLEATLRQAKFLLFQYQDEVAKKDVLFHRQGDEGIAPAIRDTLPYFLGAVPEDQLARRQELRQARRRLKLLERRLRDAEAVRGDGMSRAAGLLLEAQAVGLLPAGEPPPDFAGMLELLRTVQFTPASEQAASVGEAIHRLREERTRLRADHQRVQQEIEDAETYAAEQEGFTSEATEQRVRLESINLLGDEAGGDDPCCPLCHHPVREQVPAVSQLRSALSRLAEHLDAVGRERPRLRGYLDERAGVLADLATRLAANRQALEALMAQNADLQARHDQDLARSRVMGRIEMFRESVGESDEEAGLGGEVEAARALVRRLEEQLQEEDLEEALESALRLVSQQMSRWCSDLGLEYSQFSLSLNLTRLTVIADTPSGPVPMQQMGSGQNWLWCHLLAYFALHRWFVQRNRPVPRFLILDQPTQVYYPVERDAGGSLDVLEDADRAAVKRLFRWLADRVEELKGSLQVIVTDHAEVGESWFDAAVVERWRDGNALVPQEWITNRQPQ